MVTTGKSKKNHFCTKCHQKTAVCSYEFDSDGAAWSYVTWKHNCINCGYEEKYLAQYPYNFEEFDTCQICGEKFE